MLKETLSHLDMAELTTAGLVLFVLVFVAVLFYALTRTPGQARHWSRIPLTDETQHPGVRRERPNHE
jgi:cbb3-type cytochrome oxidase subunit 3